MSEQIKIYVRNSQKYGKILNVSSFISAQQLYRKAAQSQNLNADYVQLILGGRPIPNDSTEIQLKEKAIVHIINRRQVELDLITVKIKSLYGRSEPANFETRSSAMVGSFINQNLVGIYGQSSEQLILVHIGRQLDAQKTFQEELIENNSQLICASLQQIRLRNSPKPVEEEVINVPIKDLQVPEQPKDIYPSPNFTISVPQEINANNNLDLIFDSKVRHATSFPNCDLQPQEIIQQEELTPKLSEQVRDVEEAQEYQNEQVVQTTEYEAAEVERKQPQPQKQTQIVQANQAYTAEISQSPVETIAKEEVQNYESIQPTQNTYNQQIEKIQNQQQSKIINESNYFNDIQYQPQINTEFGQSEEPPAF